jgi:hypothetical protein
MKRFAYILTILSVMLLTVNSCVVVADDDWDDGYSSYYDYICNGRWYPESPSGLTECEYNSYMTFSSNGNFDHYNCAGTDYDYGSYHFYQDELVIDYQNGDEDIYYIVDINYGSMILRSANTGARYYYVSR